MFYNKSFGFKSWALGRFELLVLLVYPVYFCCRSNNLNEKVFNEEIHSRLIASFLLGLHIMKVLKRGNKLKNLSENAESNGRLCITLHFTINMK